ncbi:MAG: ribbon-helix-helix protein, CopG family [Thermoplasmata archaeon]|nr:MAG: ribbon-helix-helix protein, CopG family [Thermoplasmata archaeon]
MSDICKSKKVKLAYRGTGTRMRPETEKITIRVPTKFVNALDFLVEVDDFPSRSEAIRAAIRDLVYNRVEMVMDKIKKMQEAEQALTSMKEFESQYLKK